MALSPLQPEDEAAVPESLFAVQPLKTYALNLDTGELGGIVDGRDAVSQFVNKAIMTARYRFAIYDDDYGCEIEAIIGQDVSPALLEMEIPRVITEALIYDPRIANVYGFAITRDSDNLFVSFFVETDNETIPVEVTI